MNRAASFLWAASVALVLSGPVFADKKVIDFKRPVSHTNVIGADSSDFKVSSTQTVDEQIIANRKGSNVARFKPRGNAKLPRAAVKQRYKLALKANVAQLALTAVIAGAIAGVDWVMSDENTKIRKKTSEGSSVPASTYRWCGGGGLGNEYCAATHSEAANTVNTARCNPVSYSSCKITRQVTNSSTEITYYFRRTRITDGSQDNEASAIFYKNGNCSSPNYLVNGNCYSGSATYADITDGELDQFVSQVDTWSPLQAQNSIQELCAIDPLLCTLRPSSFTNPDGTLNQRIVSPVTSTSIARVNPDGSISRLTRNQWSDFFLNYSPTGPDVEYKVENKTEPKDEAGNTV